MTDRPPLLITDRPGLNRFEARRDAHTEVPPAFEGQGIASAMARHVLEELRTRHERVAIRCPYLRTYVARHPELAPGADDLIPAEVDR